MMVMPIVINYLKHSLFILKNPSPAIKKSIPNGRRFPWEYRSQPVNGPCLFKEPMENRQ
jgi:hypothetical protein